MILLHWAQVPARLPRHVVATWLDRLPVKRRVALARELDAGRGLESLTGLALLAGCGQYLPLPRLAMLGEDPGGKPRWSDGPEFSIAHAAGHALCAVAPAGVAIGVDLESANAANAESLRLVASAAERAEITDGNLSATALWTCKEAVLKAAGAGILEARQVEIAGALGHFAGHAYHLKRLGLDRNFILTIATTVPVPGLQIVRATTSTLFDAPSVGRRRSSA